MTTGSLQTAKILELVPQSHELQILIKIKSFLER